MDMTFNIPEDKARHHNQEDSGNQRKKEGQSKGSGKGNWYSAVSGQGHWNHSQDHDEVALQGEQSQDLGVICVAVRCSGGGAFLVGGKPQIRVQVSNPEFYVGQRSLQ